MANNLRSEIVSRLDTKVIICMMALALLSSYLISLYRAFASPLSHVPGPWFAKFTTMHLRWLFARGTIWKFVSEEHRKHGPIVRLGPRQVWVADKMAMKDILSTTDLPKVSMYAEISRDRLSPGLFGEIRPHPHKILKRFLSPAFTVASVDRLDSFFMDCVAKLLRNYYESLQSCRGIEVRTDLMRDLHCLALDIMGESAFGKGFGQIDQVFHPSQVVSQRDKAWSLIPDAIFKGLANRYRTVFLKRFLRRCGLDLNFDWPKEMTQAISTLIDDRKISEKSDRTDVLQHMMEEGSRPDTGVPMNNREIIDQMSELLLAGSETTSGTIGCLFLELARNPEVKAKLLNSLPPLGPHDSIIDSKAVRTDSKFRYLEACIKENLRMHPIASEMGRRTGKQDFHVGKYHFPPQTIVSASYRDLHLNSDYWPMPNRFWPERWLEGGERGDAPRPDMEAFYPFSAGSHSCIGKNFAYAEIRTISANILSRFDVEEAGYQAIDFRQFITMQFQHGSWIARLLPRYPLE